MFNTVSYAWPIRKWNNKHHKNLSIQNHILILSSLCEPVKILPLYLTFILKSYSLLLVHQFIQWMFFLAWVPDSLYSVLMHTQINSSCARLCFSICLEGVSRDAKHFRSFCELCANLWLLMYFLTCLWSDQQLILMIFMLIEKFSCAGHLKFLFRLRTKLYCQCKPTTMIDCSTVVNIVM